MSQTNEPVIDEKKKLVTRKDFVYWIIFLAFIIVLLLVWKWDDEQQLTNQISLVGSVSSILLALVAIGYAFFQSQNSSNDNKVMLQTLLRINDEISKLESVNKSLKNLRTEFTSMKGESSVFQEKVEVGLNNLKTSLEDKSWIDSIETDTGEKISKDLKEKLKTEYTSHIERNIEKAFQIDSELMAKILSYIYHMENGERIDEDKLIEYLSERYSIKANGHDIFRELEKLNHTGIITLVVDKNDQEKRVFAIKTGQAELLKPVEEN